MVSSLSLPTSCWAPCFIEMPGIREAPIYDASQGGVATAPFDERSPPLGNRQDKDVYKNRGVVCNLQDLLLY